MMQQIKLTICIVFLVIITIIACKKEYSYEGGLRMNIPPEANAGPDQLILLPKDSVLLDARNSIDSDGTIIKYVWIKIAGPASYSIANANSSTTTVRTLVQGMYQFELTVIDDKSASSKDTIQVTVNPANPNNQPPVANAGVDQLINLPVNSCSLNGSPSYDPDGSITNYQWTKINGPASFTISTPTAAQTPVTNMSEGIYLFELTVTDNRGATAKDTVQISVLLPNAPPCNIGNRPRINATLTQVGTLGVARFPYAGAAGSKIVFAGGSYYTSPHYFWVLKNVDIYDKNTGIWTTAQLSQEREGIAVVNKGNKIFFAGGGFFGDLFGSNLSDSAFDNIDIYDASTNTWSLARLSQPRCYLATATSGNKIVFAGGIKTGAAPSDNVDIYDVSTNSWSVATLSEPRVDVEAVAVGDKIYFAGGYNGLTRSSRIDIFNTTTNAWSTTSLHELSGPVSGVAKGDQIFWAGQTGSGINSTSKVEFWNATSGYLITYCLSYSRYTPVATVRNNEVAFFVDNGWWFDDAVISNQFDIYNSQTGQWSVAVLPLSIASPAIVNVNNNIYMGGGKTSIYTCTDKVYILNW